jgi:hypothetical protein
MDEEEFRSQVLHSAIVGRYSHRLHVPILKSAIRDEVVIAVRPPVLMPRFLLLIYIPIELVAIDWQVFKRV